MIEEDEEAGLTIMHERIQVRTRVVVI
jgi:hypothetical protein